jgi:3'-phosphoadenosine 5'-phosphosulfate sulfotransferase (PAPS reductase)/FAD synthetase
MKHIVSFSGGLGSYATAKRVIEQHGKENVMLVFTDTKIEDKDLYRFIDDVVNSLEVEYLYLAEGRDVWEVFFDEKYMGNSRYGNCTKRLKQEVFRKWLEANYAPNECIVYLGIDWTESHRYERAVPHWIPYTVKAPLCDEPYITKEDIFEDLKKSNIEIPRLYKLGFSHNNCGGFCVKAGHGHFKNLLEKIPNLYKYHEEKEQEFRNTFNKDVSILKKEKTVNGVRLSRPFTLKELREQLEKKDMEQLDLFDVGGCGCFIEFE